MSRNSLSKTPVIVVALLALVVGTVGTTTVGYAAAAITKAQVKKIAKKQANKAIKKAAPTLAVASATNATNATNLNGLPAAAYQDRVAFTSNVGAAIPAAATQSAVLNITVPAGVNFVKATAVSSFQGGSSYVLWLQADSVCSTVSGPITTTSIDFRTFGNPSSGIQPGSHQWTFPATPGVHTYRLCTFSSTGAATLNPSLLLETTAVGASGGTTITKPAPGRPDSDGQLDTVQ